MLEHNAVTWAPCTKKSINQLEKVQQRMRRLISDKTLRSLSYAEKMRKIDIPSLRARSIQQELQLLFKRRNGMVGLDFHKINSTARAND